MIQIGSALSVENTGLVELEARLISLDTDGDGLSGDCLSESLGLVGSDFSAVLDLVDLHGVLVGALSVTSAVRVLGLVGDSVIDNVPHGSVHISSVASFIGVDSSSTVNQLLFGERVQGSLLDGTESLEGTGSRECPARSALSLILEGSDDTSLSLPIDRRGERRNGLNSSSANLGGGLSPLESGVGGLELLSVEIGKLVDGEIV